MGVITKPAEISGFYSMIRRYYGIVLIEEDSAFFLFGHSWGTCLALIEIGQDGSRTKYFSFMNNPNPLTRSQTTWKS